MFSEEIIKHMESNPELYKWKEISKVKGLSPDFIRKFCDRLNWITLSVSSELSEDLILEFSNQVSWSLICFYQKLSKTFIAENFSKLKLAYLMSNKNISEETKNYIRMFL